MIILNIWIKCSFVSLWLLFIAKFEYCIILVIAKKFQTAFSIFKIVAVCHIGFYRGMLCIRGTSHGPVSVCLSVRLCLFKDLREIRLGSPPTRALNAGGVVKIGDFRQITGYISKTVKDRHIVSIKVE